MLISAGIDPGKKGAVVAITATRKLWRYMDQPTVQETKTRVVVDLRGSYQELSAWKQGARTDGHDLRVVLETGTPRPGQSRQSTASISRSVTMWEVILIALDIPHRLVPPQTWTRVALKGFKGEGKQRALNRAEAELPELITRGPRGGAMDGRADAACIALYGLDHVWRGMGA